MRKLATCIVLALCAAGASAQTRETQAEHLQRFEKYAGAPVDEFEFWSLYKWELVGPEKVVIWPTINQAYLVSVHAPCPGLEFARGIGVTSQQRHIVSAKFDYVTYGRGQQCAISEIKPIDYKTMLKDGPDAK